MHNITNLLEIPVYLVYHSVNCNRLNVDLAGFLGVIFAPLQLCKLCDIIKSYTILASYVKLYRVLLG